MDAIHFDILNPHPPGEFCKRITSAHYFIGFFETPFRYEYEGKLLNGDSGSVLIMEPGLPVYHGPAADATEGFVNDWVYLTGADFAKLLDKYPLPRNVPFSIGKTNPLRPYIEKIRKEKRLQNAGYLDVIYFLTGQLIVELYRLYRCNLPDVVSEYRLETAREQILLNPERPWSLQEMAELSGYSISRFCVLYRKKFGCSPKQDLLGARIQQAQQILKFTNRTVSETAILCGFETIYYFSKYFKTVTGMSPKAYADSCRQL